MHQPTHLLHAPSILYPPPPMSMARTVFLLSRGGGPFAKGAMFLLLKGGGGPLTRARGAIDANSHQNSKKNYLCAHFLACAIGVNMVGTNAWYLLHL